MNANCQLFKLLMLQNWLILKYWETLKKFEGRLRWEKRWRKRQNHCQGKMLLQEYSLKGQVFKFKELYRRKGHKIHFKESTEVLAWMKILIFWMALRWTQQRHLDHWRIWCIITKKPRTLFFQNLHKRPNSK